MRIASGILQKYPLYSCLVSTSLKYSTMFFLLFPILYLWLPFCKIDFRVAYNPHFVSHYKTNNNQKGRKRLICIFLFLFKQIVQ